jgi:hypothetical protein
MATETPTHKDVLTKPAAHVPNPVPRLERVKALPTVTKKLKVEEIYTNNTLLVKDGGEDHIVSIPVNREVRPEEGDTVEVRLVGEKGSIVASLVKPVKDAEAKKPAAK